MAFCTIEDSHGAVECVFFADPFAASQRVLDADQPVVVSGKLEKGEEGNKILAESAELLSDIRERRTARIDLELSAAELANGRLGAPQQLLAGSKGSGRVRLHVRFPELGAMATLKLKSELAVVPDETLMQGLETLFRRANVARLT